MYGADYDFDRGWGPADDELDEEMMFLGVVLIGVALGVLLGLAGAVFGLTRE